MAFQLAGPQMPSTVRPSGMRPLASANSPPSGTSTAETAALASACRSSVEAKMELQLKSSDHVVSE